MKRVMASVVVLLLLGAAIAGAQEQSGTQIVEIELGFVGGYRLAQPELVGGQSFGLNLAVGPNFMAGVQAVSVTGPGGTDAYGMFGLSYLFGQSLGLSVLAGGTGGGSVSGGLMMFFNLFQNQDSNTFTSALKLKAGYLFNVAAGIADGSIVLGVASAFGM
jgi:hypothetical protein